jgi:hypothetical protein
MTTTPRFAENTDVTVERSRTELDALLAKHGASQRASYVDDDEGHAAVQFRLAGRMARLQVKYPKPGDVTAPSNRGGLSEAEWRRRQIEQKQRTAWRRLLLVVKAKLEIIADGGSTFEREFLADILLPDGQTVHELLEAKLETSYRTGGMPKLMLGPGGK